MMKENVTQTLGDQFKPLGLQEPTIKGLRTVFGDTPTGTISLPTEAALNLLAFGEMKISEFFCRLREQVSLTRCLRCLAFDQITTIRTNGNSKSKDIANVLVKEKAIATITLNVCSFRRREGIDCSHTADTRYLV